MLNIKDIQKPQIDEYIKTQQGQEEIFPRGIDFLMLINKTPTGAAIGFRYLFAQVAQKLFPGLSKIEAGEKLIEFVRDFYEHALDLSQQIKKDTNSFKKENEALFKKAGDLLYSTLSMINYRKEEITRMNRKKQDVINNLQKLKTDNVVSSEFVEELKKSTIEKIEREQAEQIVKLNAEIEELEKTKEKLERYLVSYDEKYLEGIEL